jgi:hypothetical protein
LVFQNTGFFSGQNGKGLLNKFKNAVDQAPTIDQLAEELFNALKGGGKAELALDLLEIESSQLLVPPTYIHEGLVWLAKQLRQHHEDLGLAAPVGGVLQEIKKAA